MTGTTYADLVTRAGDQIAAGALDVRRRPFDKLDEAQLALRDFHAVLDAIETHTWSLIGPSRLAGISTETRADPVVADAIHMVAGIRELVGADRPHPSMLDVTQRPWRVAALQLRGASDLLGVHLDAWGRQRSPDAPLLGDAAARDGALARVADQLDTLLAAETTLALRCLQTGATKADVTRWLPGLDANRAFAQHLNRHAPEVDGPDTLDGLRLIGEEPRTDDPVLHAADLINRLRQATWALRAEPDYSVVTLSDLATAGLAIHAHAAAAHGSDLTTAPPVTTEASLGLVQRARIWRDLRADLTTYRAPGPPHPRIRADVLTLRDVLGHLAPLDGTAPSDARVPPLLLSGTRASQEIARTAGDVLHRLAASGHLHVQGRHLTSDQLGNDGDLITASVTGTRVMAPRARWQISTDLWQTAAGGCSSRSSLVEQSVAATFGTQPAHVLLRTPLERSHG
ncbi:MAG TPA: hypothetical protein VGK17_17175 [Propionicimonas sp.]|jgi:hypothetical protein